MAKNADWYIDNNIVGGDKSGDSWINSMDEAAYEIHKEGALVAGDYHWIKDATYTLDSDIDSSLRDGTAVSPVLEIGVKAGTTNEPPVYSDWSRDAADRPAFDCVTFQIKTGDYYKVQNIEFEGDNSTVLSVGFGCIVENCKFDNDYSVGATARYGITLADGSLSLNS